MNHLALADLFRFHVNLRREGLIYTQRNCSWVSGHSNRTAYEILVKDLRGFCLLQLAANVAYKLD